MAGDLHILQLHISLIKVVALSLNESSWGFYVLDEGIVRGAYETNPVKIPQKRRFSNRGNKGRVGRMRFERTPSQENGDLNA